MTLLSNATGTDASMMLENTKPVRKSTLSSLMSFSASWRPTSGLNWSSPIRTSAGSPPSLPPFSFTASMKASRMSTPRAALGPESVLMKPILTLSAAWEGSEAAAMNRNAETSDVFFMTGFPPRRKGRPYVRRQEKSRRRGQWTSRDRKPTLLAMRTTDLAGYRPSHFRWSVEERVGVITLDRPEKKNPLTFESYAELRDLFRALLRAREVKAVVITGAGGNFCSGGDVHEIIGPLTKMSAQQQLEFTRMTGDLVKAMRACPQPILSAVDGACAGAGAILALFSDLRYGTRAARVAFLFTRVGLAGCDMGACAMLPRMIGQGRAAELLYTGRAMSGEEGLAWGFFNALAESDQVLRTTLDAAKQLASGPTFAHAMTKKMLHREWDAGLDEAIDMEAEAQAQCMQTQDFRRAYEAFAAKRKPAFEGD